jgi:hypothetical protein
MKELEQKGTLRKVNEGIVFTIDERPKMGEHYYNTIINECNFRTLRNDSLYESQDQKILASTFGVGLELQVYYNTYSKATKDEVLESMVGYEYPYTIQDNKVIIEI